MRIGKHTKSHITHNYHKPDKPVVKKKPSITFTPAVQSPPSTSLKKKIQKAQPHLRNIGSCLLVARSVARLAGKSIKGLRHTLFVNTIFIPLDIWAIKKKICKMKNQYSQNRLEFKRNLTDNSMVVGVHFSGMLKGTADFLAALTFAEVGGEKLVLASNALMGVGAALSVLAIIINVKSFLKTRAFLKDIEENKENKSDQVMALDIISNLKVKDPSTRESLLNLWKNNAPKGSKADKLKTIVKERYSQKIKSIGLAILICVISIVAISIIISGVSTPVGWGLFVALGVGAIFKYLWDKHAYSNFKEKIHLLDVEQLKPQAS